MKIGLQSLSKGLRSLRLGAAMMAVAIAVSASVSGTAFATNNNGNNGHHNGGNGGSNGSAGAFFDVEKDSPQSVCYKQLGEGWKKLGFKNLDHCLRYVSTPAPEVKSDCNAGWWYVYGFNSVAQCKLWVTMHGGGGYDGDDHPEDQF
jgi:hypothetical protein